MNRAPMKRGTVRVGRAAVKRRRQGGKIAIGRDSATLAGYKALREALIARSGGVCEVHGRTDSGPCLGSEVCHVIKRSSGGADSLTNTFFGCRRANNAMDASYKTGRLTMIHVVINGVSLLDWEMVKAADKWAYQLGKYDVLSAGQIAC